MPLPTATIDKMPDADRQKVLDAIMAGTSLRKIASMVGVSAQAVNNYKHKVVLPALKTARQIQSFQPIAASSSQQLTETARLTQDIVRASPFRERLESLWERTDKNLSKAEKAGELGNAAKLIGQGHKNLEILGRATGELEVATGANIAIQIVLPGEASSAAPAFDFDITATK